MIIMLCELHDAILVDESRTALVIIKSAMFGTDLEVARLDDREYQSSTFAGSDQEYKAKLHLHLDLKLQIPRFRYKHLPRFSANQEALGCSIARECGASAG